MTKKITLFISGCFIGFGAMAQPTLTAANSAPVVGFHDQVFQNTSFLPGTAGASQTWDFSTQSYPTTGSNTYLACNTTTNCSGFPGSNIVSNTNATNGIYGYYVSNSTSFSLNGAASGTANGNLIYSNPEDLLRFPFTYGNSYVDPWTAQVQNSGFAFYRKGVDSVKADAYGTLKTPAGTFTNALRIKSISTYRDSADLGGGTSFIISYKTINYYWYDGVHKDFLYSTYTLTTNSQGSTNTSNASQYTKNQGVGVNDLVEAGIQWTVFPNPATDVLQTSISINSAITANLYLTDIVGHTVKVFPISRLFAGDNKINLSLSDVVPGAYILHLTAGDASSFKRISVMH